MVTASNLTLYMGKEAPNDTEMDASNEPDLSLTETVAKHCGNDPIDANTFVDLLNIGLMTS